MTTAEQYLLKEQLEIANFDISREINPRMRVKKASYWMGRLERRFPQLNFWTDNLLKIYESEHEQDNEIELDKREK